MMAGFRANPLQQGGRGLSYEPLAIRTQEKNMEPDLIFPDF